MSDLCLSVLFVAAALTGLAAWARRVCVWYTPDYDIEAFLHGSWVRTGSLSIGKVGWVDETLRGRYGDMEVLVRTSFRRRSLLSFGEYYHILVSKGETVPCSAQNELLRAPTAAQGPLQPGVWQFANHEKTCASGRAYFTIPVYRAVRTPLQSQADLEELLSRLCGLLLK